tara:strand:- start:424 stop:1533 length:1110 start_codon:yes stop_codon:yes gene_type:complete
LKKINFISLKSSKSRNEKILKRLDDLIKKSEFIGGSSVEKFENSFSKYVGSKYCLGVANGTDALEIAIESLNLPKKSEIIVPNFTFLSPAEAVVRGGYKLVLCDVSENGFNLDLESLKKSLSSKTSAIIVVHLFGMRCQMKEIMKIAKDNKIKVIEDCSQAHGNKSNKNKHVGSIGDIGTFSFYPTKNLGAFGDAGALTTDSKKIYSKAKKIANHGRVETYDHILAGRNSRLDSFQAAILNEKICFLDEQNNLRKLQASFYIDQIKKLKLPISILNQDTDKSNVYHQFVLAANNRNEIIQKLNNKNVDAKVYYPKTLNKMIAFRGKSSKRYNLKNSELLSKNIFSLPIGPHLDKKDIENVVIALESCFL